MAKKLSTEEILKRARAQGASGGSPSGGPSESAETAQPDEQPQHHAPQEGEGASADEEAAAQSAQDEGATEAAPAAEQTPAAPSGETPKSTKDILAAARAQDAGGKTTSSEPERQRRPSDEQKQPAATGASSSAKPKPKSTKDILAAARAAGGGAKGGPAPKPTAAKQTPKAPQQAKPTPEPKAAKPKGEHPPVKEMVEALRQGRPAETQAEEPAKPTRRPVPKKPPVSPKASRAAAEEGTSRRFVLVAVLLALFGTPFRAAWSLFTGAFGVFTLALARFMMPNVLVEPPSRFKVGPPSDYPFGTVATKWKDQYGIWVVHTNYGGKNLLYALISVCTHLGCTPNWLEGEQKFKCPCHGSGFYKDGINFEGPAPRPLERYAISIANDGQIEVDKSRKFQEEMGQWTDPACFIPA